MEPKDRDPVSQDRKPRSDQAFVVWVDSGTAPGELAGRVEHVATGARSTFTGLPDLWDFLHRNLDRSPPGS